MNEPDLPGFVERRGLPRGTETILLAEDDNAIRMLTRTILSRSGYTVCEACDGTEAVRLLKERRQEFQLLVTDLNMPGVRGEDLAFRARSYWPGIRILFVSGSPDTESTRQGLIEDQTGVRFLEKPYPPQVLAQTIREMLDAA